MQPTSILSIRLLSTKSLHPSELPLLSINLLSSCHHPLLPAYPAMINGGLVFVPSLTFCFPSSFPPIPSIFLLTHKSGNRTRRLTVLKVALEQEICQQHASMDPTRDCCSISNVARANSQNHLLLTRIFKAVSVHIHVRISSRGRKAHATTSTHMLENMLDLFNSCRQIMWNISCLGYGEVEHR